MIIAKRVKVKFPKEKFLSITINDVNPFLLSTFRYIFQNFECSFYRLYKLIFKIIDDYKICLF